MLVLGIGVNVHQGADDFPPELRASATSLALAGSPVDRLALLARLTDELDRLEAAGGRAVAMVEWRERSTLIGRQVEVRISGRDALGGVATAIDDDGALLVRTSGGVERIFAGDVREL